MTEPRIIVEPVVGTGRRVRIDAEILGVAYTTGDVLEFLRRAGLDPDQVNLCDTTLVAWHGGGPDVWT